MGISVANRPGLAGQDLCPSSLFHNELKRRPLIARHTTGPSSGSSNQQTGMIWSNSPHKSWLRALAFKWKSPPGPSCHLWREGRSQNPQWCLGTVLWPPWSFLFVYRLTPRQPLCTCWCSSGIMPWVLQRSAFSWSSPVPQICLAAWEQQPHSEQWVFSLSL